MNQALNIFRKDLHKLWPQVLVVSGLLAIYAMMIPRDLGAGVTFLTESENYLSFLILIACWILGANLVHEDAPADESPFWLTRPYDRSSLLAAKLLFLAAFVFLPLMACGIVMELRTGIGIVANAGALIVLSLGTSALWLVLPALTMGSVTRSLRAFAAGVGIVVVVYTAIGRWVLITWLARISTAPVPHSTNTAMLYPAVLVAMIVIGLQYAFRKTQWSRAILATAVIGCCILIPLNGFGLISIPAIHSGFDPAPVHIAFDETVPPRAEPSNPGLGQNCFSMALKVDGLPPETVLRDGGMASGEVKSPWLGTRMIQTAMVETSDESYREIVCFNGPDTADPHELHASLTFAVLSAKPVATIPAREGILTAGSVGRCEILRPFPENTQLRCDLARPISGSIDADLEYSGNRIYPTGFNQTGSFNLSPMSRKRFDGESVQTPGGWSFDEALSRPDAHFVLRNERVIGSFQRNLVYHRLVFPWTVNK